jgi:hypothetical protein
VEVEVEVAVGLTECVLVTGEDVAVTATVDATIVAFGIDPDAPITRRGTIGRRDTGAPTVGSFEGCAR